MGCRFSFVSGVFEVSQATKARSEVRDPEGLNAEEAARFLGIDRSTLYAQGLHDLLPHLRIGRRRIYSKSLLRDWLQEQARAGAAR